jgi:hypothetical protein
VRKIIWAAMPVLVLTSVVVAVLPSSVAGPVPGGG